MKFIILQDIMVMKLVLEQNLIMFYKKVCSKIVLKWGPMVRALFKTESVVL